MRYARGTRLRVLENIEMPEWQIEDDSDAYAHLLAEAGDIVIFRSPFGENLAVSHNGMTFEVAPDKVEPLAPPESDGDQGFGFTVRESPNDKWDVELPHTCGDWEIAHGVDHEDAIGKLEAFIEEAEEALSLLKNRQEWRA